MRQESDAQGGVGQRAGRLTWRVCGNTGDDVRWELGGRYKK